MNVKKTTSSKKIVLNIAMSITPITHGEGALLYNIVQPHDPCGFRRFLLSRSLGVGNVVAFGLGRMPWSMLISAPKDLIILLRLLKRMQFLCPFLSLLFRSLINRAYPPTKKTSRPVL